ncbi:hypothetical protein [Cohnella hashimotonis]|uniref:Uncharacterized protein n=1 Tax=Cohnella hashimotonis TaxID=2826895 RepID=A0ABT6TME1_9BACL|nr:hypothetical protein [Cohnella hashimotonis]MDI4648013.1 hypothetical protein [Cohnella hashimotonis]
MLGIKNVELITAKINDFTIGDLKFVTALNYKVEIDTVHLFDEHNHASLIINFVLVPKYSDAPKYMVTICFKKLGSVHLSADGTVIQLSGFEILDIADRGWDAIKYLVRDFENEDTFKFYCNEIEVIGIEEIEWIVG